MDNLFPHQKPHVKNLIKALSLHERALDASDTGTGKTDSAVVTCGELKLKALVLCPKSVITHWQQTFERHNVEYYGVANYETISNCKYFSMKNPTEKEQCSFIKRKKVYKDKKQKEKWSAKEDQKLKKLSKGIKEKFENNLSDKEPSFSFTFEWQNIPDDLILIFDEAHKCKNKVTMNYSILREAAQNNKIKILLLSATIADKPQKFYIAGYALRLYPNIKDAKNWIIKRGIGELNPMIGVHKIIFNEYGSRMKNSELVNTLPKNEIRGECFDMNTAKEIEEQYKIIQEEVENLKKKEDNSGCALARILYARMRIEQLKIPTITKLATKYLSQNKAVTIFVNFVASLETISEQLKTKCVIHGGQTLEERNANINNFNNDTSHVIVCNIRSGGVGISLHDTKGNYPRVSLISPSYGAIDIQQCLGRIYRVNTKTDVEQIILFCKNTIEEQICENMKDKFETMASINNGDINSYFIDGLIKLPEDFKTEEQKPTEISILLDKISVLNMRKIRLQEDLEETNLELSELKVLLNSLVI